MPASVMASTCGTRSLLLSPQSRVVDAIAVPSSRRSIQPPPPPPPRHSHRTLDAWSVPSQGLGREFCAAGQTLVAATLHEVRVTALEFSQPTCTSSLHGVRVTTLEFSQPTCTSSLHGVRVTTLGFSQPKAFGKPHREWSKLHL